MECSMMMTMHGFCRRIGLLEEATHAKHAGLYSALSQHWSK
jgi:hypothetical protein